MSIAGLDVSKYIVSLRDDGDPAFTFRSFVLGSAFTALSSVITMLYVFKPYQTQVSFTFLQRESATCLLSTHPLILQSSSSSLARHGRSSLLARKDSSGNGYRLRFASSISDSRSESKNMWFPP